MTKKKTVAKKVEEKKVETPVEETVQPVVEETPLAPKVEETPAVETEDTNEHIDEVEETIEETIPAEVEEVVEPVKPVEIEQFQRNIPNAEKGKSWVEDYTELVEVEGTYQDAKGKLYYGVKHK